MKRTTCIALLLLSCHAVAACSSASSAPDDTGSAAVDAAADVAGPDAQADRAVADATPADALPESAADAGPFVDPGIRMRDAGWRRGDLHNHTPVQGGGDDLGTVIALAEYFEAPEFLAAHPEYVGNHLDFLAITDHRSMEAISDPAFHSDKLVMLPGEEYGDDSHACIWGLKTHIPHDPDDDGVTLEDLLSGVEQAHAQGGLFSMNHPMNAGIPFPFDVRKHDAMEVWNASWTLMGSPYTQEALDAWEQEHGPASPFFERAIQFQGTTAAGQALRMYEAQLCRGVHVALVGGSDRHAFLMSGFPTSWALMDEDSVAGFLAAVKARHTFVSRTPVAATVEMSVQLGDGTYMAGDDVPTAGTDGKAQVTLRVGRAEGGRVQLVLGHACATDADVAGSSLGQPVLDEPVPSNDFTTTVTVPVVAGDWFYPVVLEPLLAPGLDPELAKGVEKTVKLAMQASEEDYGKFVEVFMDHLDASTLLAPEECDPAAWDPDMLQCIPADQKSIATYYVPDWLSRVLNAVMEEGHPSDWCMGAVASAVLFQ